MYLPFFLKRPAVAIIGKTCYDSLIEDLNYRDMHCIRYAISKGLGVVIVAGGAIVKVPQIIKILQARSAKGVSMPSYLLETIAYVITLAYNIRQHNPISTYGEAFFVTVQNLVILSLMLRYSGKNLAALLVLGSFVFFGNILSSGTETLQTDGTILSSALVSQGALTFLKAATTPLNLISKITQIIENYRNGSTGQLSAFTVFTYFAGTLARVYTTITEVDDLILLSGFLLSTLFNCVLALQMALYWNSSSEPSKFRLGEKADGTPLGRWLETKTRAEKHD